MNEALRSPETPVLTRATGRNIPKDAILHTHRPGNLKSYMVVKLMKVTKVLIKLNVESIGIQTFTWDTGHHIRVT
jgi:hypothetical protein